MAIKTKGIQTTKTDIIRVICKDTPECRMVGIADQKVEVKTSKIAFTQSLRILTERSYQDEQQPRPDS